MQSGATTPAAGWLRSPAFDLAFIGGIAGLALATGLVVGARPEWFAPILFLDLWLLGHPHVVATFTRLAFDTESFRENRWLVVGLPWLVILATLAVGAGFGSQALATTYLYWQWFHYTRQGYGVARIYGRKAGLDASQMRASVALLYLVPLWGILHRSWQDPDRFLGMPVLCLPTPRLAVALAGGAAAAALCVWILEQLRAWRAGRLPVALVLYVLSHTGVFAIGYVLIRGIDHGWLVLNVWHNAQYLMFVWLFNHKRFQDRGDTRHRLLARLSQARFASVLAYAGVCIGLGSVLYGGVALALDLDLLAAVPVASVVAYQTINFHHYVVDGLIWKVRKPKLRETLALAT